MIFLSLLVIIVCVYIIFREKGATRYFLFTLCFGFLIGVLGFTVYLNFLHERQLYLYLFWNTLRMATNDIPDLMKNMEMTTSITLINAGVLLFIYSCGCFAVSIVRPHKSNRLIYFLLGIVPALQFIIYWPWFFEKLFVFLFRGPFKDYFSFAEFYGWEEKIYYFTSIVNLNYLFGSLAVIAYSYFQSMKIRYFRAYAQLILAGYTSIVLLFTTLFWWAPKRLISVTTFSDAVHILPVSLFLEGKMLALFPYFAAISVVLLLYAVYRYNNAYQNFKNIGTSIARSIDITGVGVSYFTHMVKNYAYATLVDAEQLQRKLADGVDGTKYLDRIIANNMEMVERLSEIKSKLTMDLTDVTPIDISLPLQDALKKTDMEGVELVYEPKRNLPLVNIDRSHVSEVFLNILTNAVSEMEQDPKILVIDAFVEKERLVVTISDTGKGIPQEDLDNIFVPFYTTKNNQDNWGLGLSYCYRVITAHRGEIFVASDLGKGTTFKIRFPYV